MKKLLVVIVTMLLISSSLLIKQYHSGTNKDWLFQQNLEALSDGEESLTFECSPYSPVIYCERLCLTCKRRWRTPGKDGKFVRSLDRCVCGADLN